LEHVVGDRAAKSELFEQYARVGKALSAPKRLELIDLLAQGERTVDALARAAGVGVSTASMHLQTLRQAGLVRTRKEGTSVHYRLAGDDVAGLYADLIDVAMVHLADADRARVAFLGGDDADEAEDVPRAELLRRARSGEVVVLDVRPRHEYACGHIPGALSMPVEELEARLAELPADVEVVAYCRGAYCVLAYEAVRLLTRHGRTARRLREGMLEWRLASMPIQAGVA
jgi:DNA-binding transcriptional ArsR family regulator/rhodanese-related sulfurtransferase